MTDEKIASVTTDDPSADQAGGNDPRLARALSWTLLALGGAVAVATLVGFRWLTG